MLADAPTVMFSAGDTHPDAASLASAERTVMLDVAQARSGDLAPSTLLDEYQILDTMGSGGMGTVYKAFHRRLHKVVAVKVLHQAEEASLRRFQREMTLQARLSHPNICPVTDSGVSADGRHYLVMDFIRGAPLSKLFLDGQLTPVRAARVLAKVARAIDYAHQRGVLHRDLKPDNVLVDEAGEPHVVDFGIARELSSETPVTAVGVAIGTPYYMAPEQIRCQPDRFGPWTDIWALGAVLYHLVAARPPFFGATHLDTLRRAVTEPLPSLALPKGGSAPDALDAICRRCMAKEPGGRYKSAGELADDLDAFAEGDPISIRPPGLLSRIGWALRRHRRLLAGAGLIAGAAAAALGVLAAVAVAFLGATGAGGAPDAAGPRVALVGVAVLGVVFVAGVAGLVLRRWSPRRA
ncbi:MAG: hypothetical protein AMXMBFR64_28650 [Myxococcales bacterium]